jgi:hypothetical protein
MYQGGVIFTKKKKKEEVSDGPTSSPMRYWHFICIKYANTPSISSSASAVNNNQD